MKPFTGYDEKDPKSIEAYAQKLIGQTFSDILRAAGRAHSSDGQDYGITHENKKRKGGLGELIEECFFGYKCNNDSRADFPEAGVELKVTPFKRNKNQTVSAKERLVITMIDYLHVTEEEFYQSHLWEKVRLMLLVYYCYQPEIKNRLDYRIYYARLFTPPEKDLDVIRHDYQLILNKIRAGKAHELSGSDTLYLEAAPKASSSADRRPQPFSTTPAKPRAFALKSSYMTYVLNHFMVPGKDTYEPILPEHNHEFLEDYVVRKIAAYQGYPVEQLCAMFKLPYANPPKNLEAMIAYRILGIRSNRAEEFEKAGIVVKTIRVSNKNTIKESMSFPTFQFKELVKESWDTSTFGTYLSETRFLFIVYKFDEQNQLYLKGCQFFNIPYDDLQIHVRQVWERTKQVLEDGLQVTMEHGRYKSNLPKASENPVCHVRPHARNARDTYELPNGGCYPKQCFWLNNSYILSQLKPELVFDS